MRVTQFSEADARALAQLVSSRRAAPVSALYVVEQACERHTYAQHRALGEALGLDDLTARCTVNSNVCSLDEYAAATPVRADQVLGLAAVIALGSPAQVERILHSRYTDHM